MKQDWAARDERLWIGRVKEARPGIFGLTDVADGVYFERDQTICFAPEPDATRMRDAVEVVSRVDRVQGLVVIKGFNRVAAEDYVFTAPPGMQRRET